MKPLPHRPLVSALMQPEEVVTAERSFFFMLAFTCCVVAIKCISLYIPRLLEHFVAAPTRETHTSCFMWM